MIFKSLTSSFNPRFLVSPFFVKEIYDNIDEVVSSPLSEVAPESVSWSDDSAWDLFTPATFALGATKGAGMEDVDMIVVKAEAEQISSESISLLKQIFMEHITFSIISKGNDVLNVDTRLGPVFIKKLSNEVICQFAKQLDHNLVILWISTFKF